jgi:hypothetical protein
MEIGERIGAKERTYYRGEYQDLAIHTAWFPMIEVNGRMVYIKSPSPTGKLEADSLGEAIRLASDFRDSLRKTSVKPQRSVIEE